MVVGPVAISLRPNVVVEVLFNAAVYRQDCVVTTVPLLAANRESQLAVQAGFVAHPEADAIEADSDEYQLAGEGGATKLPSELV